MTAQLSLLDSLAARDAAIAQVDDHASDDWKDRALAAVYQVANRLAYFAADDIWATGLEKPREPRALGPVMLRAVRLGYCVATPGSRSTSLVSSHARPIRIYRSRLCS